VQLAQRIAVPVHSSWSRTTTASGVVCAQVASCTRHTAGRSFGGSPSHHALHAKPQGAGFEPVTHACTSSHTHMHTRTHARSCNIHTTSRTPTRHRALTQWPMRALHHTHTFICKHAPSHMYAPSHTARPHTPQGAGSVAKLVGEADRGVRVVAAGNITSENVGELVGRTGVLEVHSSARRWAVAGRGLG